jgi:hypothetical protein
MMMPTATIRLRSTAVVLTMLVAVLGCGGGAGSSAGQSGGLAVTPGAPDTIVIHNFTFMPAS